MKLPNRSYEYEIIGKNNAHTSVAYEVIFPIKAFLFSPLNISIDTNPGDKDAADIHRP